MAGRRTNLALLAALAVAFGSGALAFAIGSGWNRWAIATHAVAGFVIVLLTPWKSVIARRGLRRRRPGRAASIAFAVLVVAAVVSGVLHAVGVVELGDLTAMQLHVGAALLTLPLAAAHVARRRVRPHRSDAARRQLLRSAGLIAGGAVAYVAVEGVARLASLRGGVRRFTGSYERGSFEPNAMPVTQWLDDPVPSIDGEEWTLSIAGRRLTYADVAAATETMRATLDCTGGWWAEQDWSGIPLSDLLPRDPNARSIVVRSATGYARRYPIGDASRLLLATGVGGRPLSPGHGYPARIVAPGRRGFWWVKWVVSIEVSDRPWWLQPPFPVT
jgi:DMSO/TMAO reductase YedYZ molybdopterin-dependent catalytic subunit